MTLLEPHAPLVFPRSWRGYNAYQVCQLLGLTGGLQLCLDAGAEASYGGSGQVWADLTPNGHDFNRGADGTSEASDPTFNGTAGRVSGGEYWGFDGGDWLTYDSANEAWMNRLHQNSALFSLFGYVYISGEGAQFIVATMTNNVNTDHGIVLVKTVGEALRINVMNASGTAALGRNLSGTLTLNAWHAVGVSIDEAAGADGSFGFLDGAVSTFDGTYSSPSDVSATSTMALAAAGGGASPFDDGSRMAIMCAWEGRALSAGEMTAMFDATRGRFNI